MSALREDPLEGEYIADDGLPPITDAQVSVAEREGRTLPPALIEQQWQPGQSGNPTGRNGRIPGLAKRVREAINDDPSEVIQVLLDIALSHREKSTDRIAAARELLDRGYGKAPAHAPIEGGDPLEQNELDRAIRDIAEQLTRRAHPVLEPEVIRTPQEVE